MKRSLYLLVLASGLMQAASTSKASIEKHIVAIGGGKITDAARPSAIRTYLIKLASDARNKRSETDSTGKVKICLLPHARLGDKSYDQFVQDFTASFEKEGAEVSWLSLAGSVDEKKVEEQLLSSDMIYVSGGNTRTMLGVWYAWNIHLLLAKAHEKGIVLAGSSAGAICWFKWGITDSTAPLSVLPCLGMLPEVCCPHFDSEGDTRKPFFEEVMKADTINGTAKTNGIALCDYTAAHITANPNYNPLTWRPKYTSRTIKWPSPLEATGEGEPADSKILPLKERTVWLYQKGESRALPAEEIE